MRSPQRNAFTLVELLVVIAIIGVLVALLLPAVQAAREAVRRSQCSNQLKQAALAWQLHHDAHKFFPSGGWGYKWTGDPNRGYGKTQSGSWAYSCLPFMEQSQLHQRGKGATNPQLSTILSEVARTPVATFYCPSRRSPQAYHNADAGFANENFGDPPTIARIDYAANAGPRTGQLPFPGDPTYSGWYTQWGQGPAKTADLTSDASFVQSKIDPSKYLQGVVFQRSQISIKHITDGTSNTYMIGEKSVDPQWYDGGANSNPQFKDLGDDQGAWVSDDLDTTRNSGPDPRDVRLQPNSLPPRQDQIASAMSTIDRDQRNWTFTFGSAHPATFQMAMCDASVRTVAYDVDPLTFNQQGTRAGDETPATAP